MFKKILALHTGGTISMAADDSGAVITNEVNPMTQVTSPIEGIAVTSEDFFNLPSPQMTPRHMLALYQKNQRGSPQLRRHRHHPWDRYAGRNGLFLGYHGVTRDRCGHYRSHA